MKALRSFGTVATLLSVLAVPATAQTREGLMGDLLKDIAEVETKVVGLAKALPEGTYSWRPSPGVRSTGEIGRAGLRSSGVATTRPP